MGGKRLENYWSYEIKSILESYHQFEALLPASTGKGALHHGEDGRYIESILKEMLRKFLPRGIEILSGFILRPGVKDSMSGKARGKDEDRNSSQLDMIVYDTQNFPVFQRFGDTAVVLPEGVIGIISVKKTIYQQELSHEIKMLRAASELCAFRDRKGPFLALVGMDDRINDHALKCSEKVFEAIKKEVSAKKPICYEDMPCFIGSLEKWTIHKVHKKGKRCAEFQLYVHKRNENHLGLQYLLKGILDVYYSEGRNHGMQPGYISFPEGKQYEGDVLRIFYDCEQSCRTRVN